LNHNKLNNMYGLIPYKSTPYHDYHMTYSGKHIPPGQMQYRVNPDGLKQLNLDELEETTENYYSGYRLVEHSPENIRRLTPDTATGRALGPQWKALMIIQTSDRHMKAALQHRETGEIALITTAHTSLERPNENRAPLNSMDPDWKVSWCKMIAPLFFWKELKNRL
jgi:hypothetical protein